MAAASAGRLPSSSATSSSSASCLEPASASCSRCSKPSSSKPAADPRDQQCDRRPVLQHQYQGEQREAVLGGMDREAPSGFGGILALADFGTAVYGADNTGVTGY